MRCGTWSPPSTRGAAANVRSSRAAYGSRTARRAVRRTPAPAPAIPTSGRFDRMTTAAVRQYVTFSLMGEEYALKIHHVREIIAYEPITAIPSMPPVVRGVMNLRGFVVPIIDLPV